MIPTGLYERYGLALDGAADAVTAAVTELFGMLDGLSGSEYANALDAGYRSLVALYGRAAAEAAVEFYAAVRSAQGVEGGFTPTVPQADSQRGLSGDVRRAMAAGDAAVDVLSGSAVKRTMERADGAIAANAARDPAKPRWARVPHAGACGWCVMIGSRGFSYTSREKADATRHANCRCRTVVDFEAEAGLSGYDPGRLYESYSECRAAVADDAERAWAAMGEAERARYGSRDKYLRNRIVSEMNSRDRNWLMTGEPVKVDYSLNPKENYGKLMKPGDYSRGNIADRGNEWRDLWAHHVLEMNGVKAQVHGKDDIDLTIGGEWWEVKSPDNPKQPPKSGRELSFVEKNLRTAAHQFEKRGLGGARVVFNPRYRCVSDDANMIAEIRKRMRVHNVVEVLFINSDGTLTRIKN